jgi:PAS domain S-box-containing protein
MELIQNKAATLRAKFIIISFFIVPFLCISSAYPASPVIKVSLSTNPPLVFTDDDGNASGFFVDVIKYIAEKEGWTLQFEPCTWKECQDKLEKAEIDILMSVAFTQERAEKFDFTEEMLFNNWAVVYREPLSQIDGIEDLWGERIASVKGNIHTRALTELLNKFGISGKVIEVDNYVDVFRQVHDGKASAGVVNRVNGIRLEKKYSVEKTSIIFNPVELFFATPKGKLDNIRAAIDMNVRDLKADLNSVYYESMKSWLSGVEATLPFEPKDASDKRPIIIAGHRNVPPVESLKSGRPEGMNIDLLKALSQAIGRKIEIHLTEWSKAQEKVLNGKADALTIMTPTKKRRTSYDFSETLLEFEFVLFVSEKNVTIHGLKDVEGGTVGVTKGGYPRQIIESNRNIKIHLIKDYLEGFRLLQSGEIDAVAAEKWSGTYTLQDNGIDNISLVQKPLAVNQTSIAVKRGNTALLNEINKGIEVLKEKGTVKAILDEWSGKRMVFITKERFEHYGYYGIIVILSVIVVGSVSWVITLRARVRKRTKQLQHAHDSLELRVNERTSELTKANEHLEIEIAERKKTEAYLRESQDRFQGAFESASIGIGLVSPEGKWLKVNPALCNIIGYSEEELLSLTFQDITYPDDLEADMEYVRQLLAGEIPYYHMEKRYIHKQGQIVWILLNGSLVRDENGSPLHFVSQIQDITERKKMEKLIIQAKEEWEDTFDTINDAITIHDKDFNIIRANKAAEEMLGLPMLDIFKQKCYKSYHGTDCPPEGCPSCQVLNTGLPTSIEIFEPHLNKFVEIKALPRYSENNNLIGLVHIVRDITDRKRIEEESLKIQKLESVGIMAGGLAHDFNNLLQSIFLNVSTAKMLSEKGSDVHKILKETEKNLNKTKYLTTQLLTFSKGGVPIKKTLYLSPVVRDSVKFALSGSNVKSEISIADDLWPVEADEGQISQVIQNIVLNADQAMPAGGLIKVSAGHERIDKGEVVPLKEGEYVVICIEDNGIGIPQEHLSKIFDPYFTTKQRGSGLGLATAYSIIAKHAGLLTVDSETGNGSTFSIYLPASAREVPKASEDNAAIISGVGRILIMDDDKDIRASVEVFIERIGYEVEFAEDGTQAIEMYNKGLDTGRTFDAVILDLTVPGGMGGKEAIIKLLEIDPKVKVVVSSGYADDPIMSEYRNYGFSAALSKPYSIKALSKLLHEVLKRS